MSVRPKKGLGQHFLVDAAAIATIVGAVDAPEGSRVVEIGPGAGALTGPLLARYPGLVALEVDAEAIAHLRARYPALDVRQGDVLEADWGAIRREGGPSAPPLTVVGNLPYYISSPILFALLGARADVGRAVVMLQKEVADRLVAPPGGKTYGTLSVYFALWARAAPVLDVPAAAFRPPPKVESAVVALDFRGADGPDVDSAALRRVVRAAFGQRRKMLRNSLRPLFAAAGLDVPGWAATRRPEAVSPGDFVRLAAALGAPAPDAPRPT